MSDLQCISSGVWYGRVIELTMNVATFAIVGPHVSTMISRVSALVLISIPLLTKMISGRLFSSRVGFSARSVSLR